MTVPGLGPVVVIIPGVNEFSRLHVERPAEAQEV